MTLLLHLQGESNFSEYIQASSEGLAAPLHSCIIMRRASSVNVPLDKLRGFTFEMFSEMYKFHDADDLMSRASRAEPSKSSEASASHTLQATKNPAGMR